MWFRPYLCYESVMVFAPGGDRGCPHQPVRVAMCLTVSVVRPLGHKCLCNPWTDTDKTGADVMDRP